MGNQQTKFGLRLDRDKYEAGGVITGRVYLALPKPGTSGRGTHHHRITGLHLCFSGEEYAQIARKAKGHPHKHSRSHSGHHYEYEPVIEKSTQVLVRQDFPLVNLRGVREGQYEYPFELPLPAELPTSMSCQAGHGSKKENFCEIRYRLTAYLAREGAGMFFQNDTAETSVNIIARPVLQPHPPTPLRMETETYPVNTCFFWTKGHIQLGWQADRTDVAPGETIVIEVCGENKSQLEVEKISVKWVETVTWKTVGSTDTSNQTHRKSSKRTIASQSLSVTRLPQWVPRENSSESLVQQDSMHEPVRFTLELPRDTRDSYAGSAVQVSHMLVVKVATGGGIMTTSPDSACQVRVVRHSAQENHGRPSSTTPAVATAVAVDNTPSMPPSASSATTTTSTSATTSSSFVQHDTENLVHAEALPPDWHPFEADVIVIPEAAAVVIDEGVAPMSSSYIASAPREEDILYHPSNTASNQASTTSSVASAPPESLLDTSAPSTTGPSTDPSTLRQIQTIISDSPENLAALLADSYWTASVQSLDPREFCSLIKAAHPKAAPNVARILAVTLGTQFQCRYIVACVWALPDETRMPVVCKIAGLASDLATNRATIEQELRDYELVQFRMSLVCE